MPVPGLPEALSAGGLEGKESGAALRGAEKDCFDTIGAVLAALFVFPERRKGVANPQRCSSVTGGEGRKTVLEGGRSQAQKKLDKGGRGRYNVSVRHEGRAMVIDLKKYFTAPRDSEGPCDTVEFPADLSGVELVGVKPFCAPVQVQARIKAFAGSALVDIHAVYTVTKPCDRCCETVNREYARDFSHTVVRSLNDEEDGGEYLVVEDERLDLDELLREDILLDMPSKFLCSPECKGLCPSCGKNLNQGPCGCNRKEPDPRLAVLKSLLE